MNEIMVAFGIACVVISLYRLGVLYKKNTNISKNTLFVGTVTTVLLLEMLDAFTIDWLSDYLGRIYYNRFIGVLLDAMLIGIAFREPNEGLSYKEAMWARIQVLSSAAIFSWLFMYYFCK